MREHQKHLLEWDHSLGNRTGHSTYAHTILELLLGNTSTYGRWRPPSPFLVAELGTESGMGWLRCRHGTLPPPGHPSCLPLYS